jgi:hypothetical protein
MLTGLQTARSECTRLRADEARVRGELLALFDEGADIQPGPLALRVEDREKVQLTERGLAKVLGEDEAQWLLRRLPVTKFRYVRVVGVAGGGLWEPDPF